MYTIAISANTSWYLYNFRQNTIRELINHGNSVIAIAPYDEYSSKLEELGAMFIDIPIDQGGTNPIKDLKTILRFNQIYKNNSIDVVLNFTPKNNIYSTFVASWHQIKVINNIAGLGTLFINETVVSKVARILYKYSQRKAQKIFFQNDEDRDLFLKHKYVKSKVTERLPGSGVDLSRFSVKSAPDDEVVRFLLIARMIYEKGIIEYITAARNLKKIYGDQVEFRLLGFLDVNNPSAISKKEMQSWVDENIINYLGISDQVEYEIAQVDCIVLPSFYREGVPKSLLEAGAMGKPIVTTNNVGCKETVDDGVNGFLCIPRDSKSLQDALERIINLSHQQRLNMGLKSRKKIENEFDEKIVINKYLSALKDVLNDK